jgi:hypothetical protein
MHKGLCAPAALAAALLMAGCKAPPGSAMHTPFEEVHDQDLTSEDFDDAMDFEPWGMDEPWGYEPVPVHEFDVNAVAQAGGRVVIVGEDWLTADDDERNHMLLDADKDYPNGTLVIVIATGDVWILPPGSNLIASGTVREWHRDEYDRLAGYVGGQPGSRFLTLAEYRLRSDIERVGELPTVHYVHDFGPIGAQEIKAHHGFEILSPELWSYASPAWRYAELHAFDHFLNQKPEFSGPGNGVAFGVAVPWGAVYAMPEAEYDRLIGTTLRPWTPAEVLGLPTVLPDPSHSARGQPIVLDVKLKP